MNVIAYTRVSTDEQAASGLGLEAQMTTIAAAADARGWQISHTFTDTGSGKDLRRPALLEALAELDRRGGILITSKLDRLSRSVLDFAGLAERAKRAGWSIVALDVDVDTTTPTGELVANISASVAQWERRIIGARTSAALQAKKANGARLGRPVTLDQQIRNRIVEAHQNGETLSGIARSLNTEGVATARGGRWHASTIAKVIESVSLDLEAEVIAEGVAV
jgi:DNA invertase Pin-like site-specific DNA recombinase